MAKRLFGIDVRSLGLFRIVLALIVLGDLAIRATALEAHYTDFGVLPRAILFDSIDWSPSFVSLHLINGTVVGQEILFLLAAVFGVALLVGYRTRIATVVTWFLLISVQTRNPMVLQGGDVLLRMMLFWGMFLPLGARFSLDARRGAVAKGIVLSWASFACLAQIAIMYACTAILKNGKEWRVDGTAVSYALYIEQFAKPIGIWIRQFPAVTRILTFGTWWLEFLSPILLFFPFFIAPMRLFAVAAFVGLHLGLYSSMELGLFPFASSTAMIPFIPAEAWDWVFARAQTWFTVPIWVEAAATTVGSWLDRLPPLPAGAAAYGRFEKMARGNSSSHSPKNSFNGYGSGGGAAAATFAHPSLRTPWYSNLLAGLALAYVTVWNVAGIKGSGVRVPTPIFGLGEIFRIDQLWDMFAPFPLRDDGWYVVEGVLGDGSQVDLLRGDGSPATYARPLNIAATYPNDRWRSYMMYLWLEKYEPYREHYASYLCRSWNRSHAGDQHLASLNLTFLHHEVRLNAPEPEPEEVPLWEHFCD